MTNLPDNIYIAIAAFLGMLVLTNLGVIVTLWLNSIKFARFLARLEFRQEATEKDTDAAHQKIRLHDDRLNEMMDIIMEVYRGKKT
jgi:hypothetical protein